MIRSKLFSVPSASSVPCFLLLAVSLATATSCSRRSTSDLPSDRTAHLEVLQIYDLERREFDRLYEEQNRLIADKGTMERLLAERKAIASTNESPTERASREDAESKGRQTLDRITKRLEQIKPEMDEQRKRAHVAKDAADAMRK